MTWRANLETPEPVRIKLADTATHVLVTADPSRKQPIAKIHAANISGSAATIDIEVFDGTTSFYLEKGRSVDANKSFEIRDDVLQVGHSLRVKAGTSNAFDVHVLYSQPILT